MPEIVHAEVVAGKFVGDAAASGIVTALLAGGAVQTVLAYDEATGNAIVPTGLSVQGSAGLYVFGAVSAGGAIAGVGVLTMSGATGFGGVVNVNGAPGTYRGVLFSSAGATRWFAYGDTAAESGGNAGSDWRLSRYSDAGAYIADAIVASRATGDVTLAESFGVVRVGAAIGGVLDKFQVNGRVHANAGVNLPTTAGYQIAGVNRLHQSGNYTIVSAPNGAQGVLFGNAADPANYYNADTHYLRNRAASVIVATIDSGFGAVGFTGLQLFVSDGAGGGTTLRLKLGPAGSGYGGGASRAAFLS